jgi:hypothetical protein
MAHANSHVGYAVYESCVIKSLEQIIGKPVPAAWFAKQVNARGQLRTVMHYQMGLSVDDAAKELEPFASAQLVNPLIKPMRWQDGCIEFVRDDKVEFILKRCHA